MERGELARVLGGGPARGGGPPVFVEEADPVRFQGAFRRAVGEGGSVFIANPDWRAAERRALAEGLASGEASETGWLMVPTGGTGGGIRFARHDGRTIAAAVAGFREHFGIERVNCVSVLPLHHVSGLMAWMRSALSGGVFLPWAWKDLEKGGLPGGDMSNFCISLVPTQLQRLLGSADTVRWLRRFRAVLLGGGPPWEGLLDQAAAEGVPLSPGYGATETAAMVAALRPAEFLSGQRGCGRALPHARIDISGGMVRVTSESVFRGYFPDASAGRTWETEDLGRLDPGGSLVILGRRDDVIVTGGKKVSASEVEAALRASGEFEDVVVVGVPDPQWGHCIVACHPGGGRVPSLERVRASLSPLAAYKHPKRFVPLSPWPRDSRGKVSRGALADLAARATG